MDFPYMDIWHLFAILLLHFYLTSQKDIRRVKMAVLPMVINVLGDGLAEPVGVRWGAGWSDRPWVATGVRTAALRVTMTLQPRPGGRAWGGASNYFVCIGLGYRSVACGAHGAALMKGSALQPEAAG